MTLLENRIAKVSLANYPVSAMLLLGFMLERLLDVKFLVVSLVYCTQLLIFCCFFNWKIRDAIQKVIARYHNMG